MMEKVKRYSQNEQEMKGMTYYWHEKKQAQMILQHLSANFRLSLSPSA